jgi:hypothetical protein
MGGGREKHQDEEKSGKECRKDANAAPISCLYIIHLSSSFGVLFLRNSPLYAQSSKIINVRIETRLSGKGKSRSPH